MDEPVESRRDALRRELVADIIGAADVQLADRGPDAITWRGVAKAVRMSPAALYTYFDDLDALLAAVRLRAFVQLASAVRGAVDHLAGFAPADRALGGMLTYRRWALRHRHHLGLMFAAAPSGTSADADASAQVSVVTPVVEVIASWRSAQPAAPLGETREIERFIGAWATLHGLVALEIAGQLAWLDTERVVEERVRDALSSLGLPAADPATLGRISAWWPTVGL